MGSSHFRGSFLTCRRIVQQQGILLVCRPAIVWHRSSASHPLFSFLHGIDVIVVLSAVWSFLKAHMGIQKQHILSVCLVNRAIA